MGKLTIKGRVIRVIDGDTLEVAVPVRMAKIDAPETKGIEKPLGEITKAWLKDRIEGDNVILEAIANDVYYRLLAYVKDDGMDVGQEMIEKKLVEVYSRGNHNNGKLDI